MRAIICAVALTGCASAPPAPVEVKVPVYVPCVHEVPVPPEFAVSALGLAASDGEKVLAIARDIPAHLQYEGRLLAVIEGCR